MRLCTKSRGGEGTGDVQRERLILGQEFQRTDFSGSNS